MAEHKVYYEPAHHERPCFEPSPQKFICTRPKGHDGEHQAHGIYDNEVPGKAHVYETWSEEILHGVVQPNFEYFETFRDIPTGDHRIIHQAEDLDPSIV